MALTQDTSLLSSKSSTQSLIIPGLIFAAILASIWLAFQGEDVSEFPVFITDAFTFTAWVNAGEDFLKDNIKVYTIGAGTNQSITQIPGRGFVRNEIDEETLKGIAEVTNAKYFRATDKESWSGIYSEIDNLEKSEITVSYFSSYQEIYIWFLSIGFFLLIIHEILRSYYFRRVI